MSKKISKNDIINNLKFLSKIHKRLSSKDLKFLYKKRQLICTTGTIHKKIGSVKKAVITSGIIYYNAMTKWNKNEIIKKFKKLNCEKTWIKKDLNNFLKKNWNYSLNKVRNHFGSIDIFAKNVGIIIKIYKNNGKALKGKTYEEIYGLKIAKKRKEDLSRYRLDKQYEDFMSQESAKSLREQKRRERLGKTFTEIFGKEKSKEIVKRMNRKGWWIIGRNEKQILDEIEKYIRIKIHRGYSVIFRNGKRRHLDGFIKEKNLNIEIDERYHKETKYQEQDKLYDKYLKEILNCDIIRIDEQKWLRDKFYKKDVKEILDKYMRIQLEEV